MNITQKEAIKAAVERAVQDVFVKTDLKSALKVPFANLDLHTKGLLANNLLLDERSSPEW